MGGGGGEGVGVRGGGREVRGDIGGGLGMDGGDVRLEMSMSMRMSRCEQLAGAGDLIQLLGCSNFCVPVGEVR